MFFCDTEYVSKKQKASKSKKISGRFFWQHNRFNLASIVLILAAFVFAFVQTPQWFFLSSGQHNIDFNAATGELENKANLAYFEGRTFQPPAQAQLLSQVTQQSPVLGESTASQKRIEVDLTNQRLYAFEGSTKVFDFVISSGRTITPTPTGEFTAWIKLRYTRMKGGSKALGTYYDLPNVPFVMFFANAQVPGWKGYGIHGTYWHNDFGRPKSHGCINMKIPEAEQLYNWANPSLNGKSVIKVTDTNPGTKVIIYGETPAS